MHKFYGVQAVKVGFERTQLVAPEENELQELTLYVLVPVWTVAPLMGIAPPGREFCGPHDTAHASTVLLRAF